MNKFASWMKSNDKKQRGVAEKLGISTSTLNDILNKGQLPNLRLAYRIEQYTRGAITLYDWLDEDDQKPLKSSTITEDTISPKRKAKKSIA